MVKPNQIEVCHVTMFGLSSAAVVRRRIRRKRHASASLSRRRLKEPIIGVSSFNGCLVGSADRLAQRRFGTRRSAAEAVLIPFVCNKKERRVIRKDDADEELEPISAATLTPCFHLSTNVCVYSRPTFCTGLCRRAAGRLFV